ncbi:MAG: 2-phosphosulfolactate phosphatase [Bacteroidota bacterium]
MASRNLYTCLSPALLDLYDISNSVVVIIDVLRATSTIATALHNGAASVIPVATVPQCIELGEALGGITAGERDGKVAEGLKYGNSPFEYPRTFIENKVLVLTTTNGTKLLHMALDRGAPEIITGSFPNLSAVCKHLIASEKDVLLGCAAWKDRVNLEDTLFAGAVIHQIKSHFNIHCDSSAVAESMYLEAGEDRFEFMKAKNATHYHRLMKYGLEKDIRYCLTADGANVLPIFKGDRLVIS